MIFDVHTHGWRYPDHFSDRFRQQAIRMRGYEIPLDSTLEDYRAHCRTVPDRVKTVVFGGKAKLAGLWTPDKFIVEYCSQDPDNLIPFLSLDPTRPGWQEELEEGHQDLKMRGIKLMPMYAGFYPQAPELDHLWQYAVRHQLPVLLHTGTTFVDRAPLDTTLPRHLDPVAIKHPECRIILAHLGHPYEGETVAVIRKHPHVYSDVSAIHYRPFQLYQSLMLVQEYGVWNKLLFGTDYPITNVDESLAGLRSINDMLEGTALPRLDPEQMEAMIHRDAGPLLGLE